MTRERVLRLAIRIAAVAFVVALTLLLLYSEPVRRVLLDPIVWIANDIRNGLAKLPQALLWAVGLLIGCAILGISWQRTLRAITSRRPPHRREPIIRPYNANAIATLARDLHRAPKRHVSRNRVVRELSIVAIRLLAKRRGIPLHEARALLRSGRWPDDPKVRRLFASRRHGEAAIRKHEFIDAVEATLAYLDHYHQEV